MYEIFLKFTNKLQAVSADEAFLDMSVFPDPLAVRSICPLSAIFTHLDADGRSGAARDQGSHRLPSKHRDL